MRWPLALATFGQPDRLRRAGAWRLSVDWYHKPLLRRVIHRYQEGTVYSVWLAWLHVKLMVKA